MTSLDLSSTPGIDIYKVILKLIITCGYFMLKQKTPDGIKNIKISTNLHAHV
jgi:hypothetical protein